MKVQLYPMTSISLTNVPPSQPYICVHRKGDPSLPHGCILCEVTVAEAKLLCDWVARLIHHRSYQWFHPHLDGWWVRMQPREEAHP